MSQTLPSPIDASKFLFVKLTDPFFSGSVAAALLSAANAAVEIRTEINNLNNFMFIDVSPE